MPKTCVLHASYIDGPVKNRSPATDKFRLPLCKYFSTDFYKKDIVGKVFALSTRGYFVFENRTRNDAATAV